MVTIIGRSRSVRFPQVQMIKVEKVGKLWKEINFFYSSIEIKVSVPWYNLNTPYERIMALNLERRELSCTKYDKWGNIEKQVGYVLTDADLDIVKPLLDVSLYEEFRADESGKMLHDDSKDELLGYMDEGTHKEFVGISNSVYPLIRISMDDYYSPERIYDKLESCLHKLLLRAEKAEPVNCDKKMRHRKRRALSREHELANRAKFTFANNYTRKD